MLSGYFKGDLPISQDPKGQFRPLSSLFSDVDVAFKPTGPSEAELAARGYNITGNPFKSIEYNLEEELLDLEIRKSRLEQAVTSSEMFPDLTLGLKLTKFDVLSCEKNVFLAWNCIFINFVFSNFCSKS